ncbi:kinase-like domain-containing protein [Rhizophagus diaphanus]|nr:kinase-like domain-containing protein [Rhizophagus diaphanus] [Rhizophagus sp. MUCL 43196]
MMELFGKIKKYLMITDKSNFVRLFGFSLNPKKNKYALVIDHNEYDWFWLLDHYLCRTLLNWSKKHKIIRSIVTLLKNLHGNRVSLNYFSPENILVYGTSVKFYIFASFGSEYIIEYTAPEILQDTGRKNDPSSDIYALGMIFYKIIFEQKLFAYIEDKSQLINKIINGARPQFLQDIPYFLRELILKCWDADPSNRPTIDELEKILLQNSIYEFQYYNFSLNDKQEFQNMSCISERFYKTSLDISNSFQLYSNQLLKSIKSDKMFYIGNNHRFKKFEIENYESGINIINKDQIIDIQMFGDSCINNINSAKIDDVKIIIKKLKNDENQLQKQLSYWNSICKYHDNIVELLGIFTDENKISLILPYAHEGNLRDYLKNKRCSLHEKIVIATDIADGILYIHKDLDIIHETLKFEKDKSMDIYSLGTLLWEIMSKKVPYSKDKGEGILQLVLKIKNNDYREEDISSVPDEYINLYKECWRGNNLSRPKIENIYERLSLIQENFFQGIDSIYDSDFYYYNNTKNTD